VRERYLHRDLRESWSRKLWSLFTAPMSRGNKESGEASQRRISGRCRASGSTKHKGQRRAWEEGDAASSRRRRDAEDGELGKRESSGGERRGRLLGHEYESEAAGKAGAPHCHRELPPMTAAGGEPTGRDGSSPQARLDPASWQRMLPRDHFLPTGPGGSQQGARHRGGWHGGAGDALVLNASQVQSWER